MIDNLFDVLYVAKTGKIKPDASLTDNLYGKKLSGGDTITTATGNPVSIVTNKAQNAISTILSFSPKQTGTGDPSPQNIRPIEGWTEANLFGCGKNLCDPDEIVHASVRTAGNGGGLGNTNEAYRTVIVDYLPKGTYTFSFDMENPYIIRVQVGGTKQGIGDGYIFETFEHNTSRITITTTQSGLFMLAFRNTDTSVIAAEPNCLLEVGSQATDYVPFITPTTITESLGGTYYGFTVDVERGVLRVTHISIAFSDIPSANWRYSNNGGAWGNYLFFTNLVERKNTTTSICSSYNFVTSTEANVPSDSYILPAWNKYLYIRDDSLTSIADFLTARGNERLVYELSTPLELPLTPQTVALLSGANTLWCDGDSLSITYKAKK